MRYNSLSPKMKKKVEKYTIQATVHGPCVILDNEVFFISDGLRFNELIDEHPGLIFDIHQAMIDQFKFETDIMTKAMTEYHRHNPSKLRDFLDSILVYNRFIYQDYPEYRSVITKAITGEVNHENVYEINPDHINKFYERLNGDIV